jgi:hypothetical protein
MAHPDKLTVLILLTLMLMGCSWVKGTLLGIELETGAIKLEPMPEPNPEFLEQQQQIADAEVKVFEVLEDTVTYPYAPLVTIAKDAAEALANSLGRPAWPLEVPDSPLDDAPELAEAAGELRGEDATKRKKEKAWIDEAEKEGAKPKIRKFAINSPVLALLGFSGVTVFALIAALRGFVRNKATVIKLVSAIGSFITSRGRYSPESVALKKVLRPELANTVSKKVVDAARERLHITSYRGNDHGNRSRQGSVGASSSPSD